VSVAKCVAYTSLQVDQLRGLVWSTLTGSNGLASLVELVCYSLACICPSDVVRWHVVCVCGTVAILCSAGAVAPMAPLCAAVHCPLVRLALFALFWTPLGRMLGVSVSLRLECVLF
jgi:hypothetical protein